MSKSRASARPLSISLKEEDRARLFSLSSHMAKKLGKPVGYTEVMREALNCLAAKEGI